jgi:triacylglycerol lipase
LRNWISNIRISTVVPFPGVPDAKVHSGFWQDYMKIHPDLVKAIQKYPSNKKIVFVGHSRGGALAAISALMFSKLGFKDRIEFMGFGMPRIGNEMFAKHFNENIPKSWRIVNQKDIGIFIHQF